MAVWSDNTEFVGEAVDVVPVSSYLKVSRFPDYVALLMEKLGRNPFAAVLRNAIDVFVAAIVAACANSCIPSLADVVTIKCREYP